MNREMIIILDFGGQYNQLIARRVREHHVYCEIMPWNKPIEEIKAKNPKGIIFTGGPNSVYDEKSPHCDPEIFELGVPVPVSYTHLDVYKRQVSESLSGTGAGL